MHKAQRLVTNGGCHDNLTEQATSANCVSQIGRADRHCF